MLDDSQFTGRKEVMAMTGRNVTILVWAAALILLLIGLLFPPFPNRIPEELTISGWLSGGVFSLGVLSAGLFSAGVYSAGLFSVGIVSAGLFSVGVFSAGVFSLGIFSFGTFAAGIWVAGQFVARRQANKE
jgi:hypothetical protein